MQSVMHMHIFLLELLIVLRDKVWEEFQSVLLHNFDSWRFFLLTWHRSKMSLPFFPASLSPLLSPLPSSSSVSWFLVFVPAKSLGRSLLLLSLSSSWKALRSLRSQSVPAAKLFKRLKDMNLEAVAWNRTPSLLFFLKTVLHLNPGWEEGTGNECGFDSIHGKRDATAAFTSSFIEGEEEEEEDQEEPGVKSGKKRQVSCRTFTRSLCPKKSLEGGRDCAANFNKRDR